jgi:hypothetical protein
VSNTGNWSGIAILKIKRKNCTWRFLALSKVLETETRETINKIKEEPHNTKYNWF